MFIINFCFNMFRASLCPSSGEQRPCYCICCVVLVLLDVVGSGCGALSCRMWALRRFLFLLTSVSTCFGHHYAHLLEIKGPVTAFGVLFLFCWMWLVADVGRCPVGCEHYEDFCSTESNRNLHSATNHIQQNQNITPNAVTGPLFSWRWV